MEEIYTHVQPTVNRLHYSISSTKEMQLFKLYYSVKATLDERHWTDSTYYCLCVAKTTLHYSSE